MASSPTRLPAPEITRRLRARYGDQLLDASEPTDQAVVRVPADRYRDVISTLRDDRELGCDFLDFVSAVDRGDDGLEVVVQLFSTRHHHTVRVKVPCEAGENGEAPHVASISDLYPGANWHERETWELFGIRFDGHPSLVKLLLPEEFEGYPLRKDFPLTTRNAKPWPGAEEGEPIEEVET